MSFTHVRVTCPTCFETFEVLAPALSELPAEMDYDCEVCCRPMVLRLYAEEEEIFGEAEGLDD